VHADGIAAAGRGRGVAALVVFALALAVPCALAWISHFFVEHNRPAVLDHCLWSWWADQKMVAPMQSGKMGDEVSRCTAN
jgi:hypothetical protein